jgi:DcmR-like sensory protein
MIKGQDWTECNTRVFWGEIASTDHLVQIYEDEDIFLGTLSRFAASGLIAGDSVIIIATREHLELLETRLKNSDIDLNTLKIMRQFIPVVAQDALEKFMIDGMPDEILFKDFVTTLVNTARRGSGRIRAFGEMVALLWEQGNTKATIQLEKLWNDFCKTDAFCLFCAYPKNGFHESAADSLNHICSEHSKVISGSHRASSEIFFQSVV